MSGRIEEIILYTLRVVHGHTIERGGAQEQKLMNIPLN